MSDLAQYTKVYVDSASKSPSQASFGVLCLVAQFLPAKTVTPYLRARTYYTLADLGLDGWTEKDSVYLAARQVFFQARVVDKLIIGRIDAADANIGVSLQAIADENNEWFGFTVLGLTSLSVTLSTALITGNVVSSSFNGVKVPDVTYATSSAATMTAWKTAIETALPGASATPVGNVLNVTLLGNDLDAVVSVAGGASVPTAAYSYTQDTTKVLGASAWCETQSRIYGYDTPDVSVAAVGTGDIASQLKTLAREHTFGIVHKKPGEYIAAAWMGEVFPYPVGSSAYSYKTMKGCTPDGFTTAQEEVILSKNCSYYTKTANIDHTFQGMVASGEFVDAVIGKLWLVARLQETVFGGRVNRRKGAMSDAGLLAEGSLIKAVMKQAENAHILVPGSTSVIVPKAADISTADKALRYAPGFECLGTLEGSIDKSKINVHLSL